MTPTGEAGRTTVLATTASEVSIIKDILTDGAHVLVSNDVHKFIVMSIIGGLVPGRKNIIIILSPFAIRSHFLSYTLCSPPTGL